MNDNIEKALHLILKKIRITEETTIEWITQFIKFGIVGVSNSIVSYGLNILVLFVLKPYHLLWDYIAGNTVSFLLSVLWSFYWNNKYVFAVKQNQNRNIWKSLLKTYASYGFTGIVLNNVLSYFWIYLFGISKLIAPLINLILCIPINFLLNKIWAFQTNEEDEMIT